MLKFSLKVLEAPFSSEEFKIGSLFEFKSEKISLGRAPHNSIVIPHKLISKNHLLFSIVENRVFVEDLKSQNGVFVNGILVKKKEIFVGDLISIDKFVFKLERNHFKNDLLKTNDTVEQKTEKKVQETDFLTIEREETEEQKKIREENEISAFDRFMERMDQLYLSKMFFYIDRVPTQLTLYLLILSTCLLIFLPNWFQIHFLTMNVLGREVQSYVRLVAQAFIQTQGILARQNKYQKMKFDDFMAYDDVEDIYILNQKGDFLAPALYKDRNLDAQEKLNGAQIDITEQDLLERMGSKIVLSTPIYEADAKVSGVNKIISVLQIIFKPKAELAYSQELRCEILNLLFWILFLSFIVYYFCLKIIAYPLKVFILQIDQILNKKSGNLFLPQKGREIKLLKDKLQEFMQQFLKKIVVEDPHILKGERLWAHQHCMGVKGHAVLIMDKNLTIIEANERCAQFLNLPVHVLTQSKFDQIFPDAEQLPLLINAIKELMEQNTDAMQVKALPAFKTADQAKWHPYMVCYEFRKYILLGFEFQPKPEKF